MPRSRSAVRAFVAAILGLALLAPVGVPAQEPSPSPSSGRGPAATVDPALADAVELALAELAAPDALAVAAAEIAAADRDALTAIDPDLPAILAELQARADEDFATFLESVPLPEPADEPGSGEPDASPAPEGRSRITFLSVVGPRLPDHARRLDQGASYLNAAGQISGWVDSFVGDSRPDKRSTSEAPQTYARTRNEAVGDITAARSTRYVLRASRDRDLLLLSVELSESYSIPSRTAGQPPIAVSDAGEVTLRVDVCPEEDGTATASVETSATVDAAGNGLTYRVDATARDTAVATVTDQADISTIDHAGDGRRVASGDVRAFSGGEGSTGSADSVIDGGSRGARTAAEERTPPRRSS